MLTTRPVTTLLFSKTWSSTGSQSSTSVPVSLSSNQYFGASSQLQIDSLLYLAAILLVITLITNLMAQIVVRRAENRGVL